MNYIGIDIGGTKCAVTRGCGTQVEKKLRFDTTTCRETLDRILEAAHKLMTPQTAAIGISCGGPLDNAKGVIQAPPNLPDWVDIPIVKILSERFGLPTYLCNDADACALAEWKYGAGQGTENMIFCTFGTGFGAGLILGGKLYSGTSGSAGEIGHVALHEGDMEKLHIGYHKAGSVEGYCSGSGIAQYGCGSAKELAEQAFGGDGKALELWKKIGADLGHTLAILVDLFNPQAIVLGSIYPRTKALLEEAMGKALQEQALPSNAADCKIFPAQLGEQIGDVAALTVAELGLQNEPADPIQKEIDKAVELLIDCYQSGGKLLTAGNGGSAADAEHIVGELMKGFLLKRPVSDPRLSPELAEKLQGALPAICLSSGLSLPTAFSNDCDGAYTIAQTLYGLAKPGDVAILISTSGNAKNLVHAAQVANSIGVKTILLSGRTGGALKKLCSISICVPEDETYRIQERHLPIYHEICARVEAAMFPGST